jgi:hypothetical protein
MITAFQLGHYYEISRFLFNKKEHSQIDSVEAIYCNCVESFLVSHFFNTLY